MTPVLTPYPELWLSLLFIAGLCIGSFLNVMALRLLSDESFVAPASHCTQCKASLKAIHNIPVLSYLWLGGQCAFCKTPISIQYPLVELLTGVLFALSFWQFGLGWPLLFVLFLICNLVVIFLTDLKESLIYQLNSLSLVPAGLLYHLLGLSGSTAVTSINLGAMVLHIPQSFCSALLGVLLAIVFFEGLILLSKMLFGTDGFGHGDTHLMMGAGAFLGWQAMATALLIGFVVQAVPAIPMLVTQWVKDRQYSALVSGGTALLLGILPTVVMNLPNTLWGIALPLEMKTGISFSALALALVAMVVFFRCIKTRASFTYLPLGPALIIGIVLMLYWGTPVQQYYKHLLLS